MIVDAILRITPSDATNVDLRDIKIVKKIELVVYFFFFLFPSSIQIPSVF
jgi:hypothetical protein